MGCSPERVASLIGFAGALACAALAFGQGPEVTTQGREVVTGLQGLVGDARPVDAFSPQVELRVGADIAVGTAPPGMMLIEPHLGAHPSDPERLLAVAHVTNADYSETGCMAFTSADAGVTWSAGTLDGGGCLDVWVTLTEERALLTGIGVHPALPDSERQLLAYFSSDDGASWTSVPQSLGRAFDGPRSTAAPDGTVYVTAGLAWRDPAGPLRAGVFVGRAARSPHVYARARILPSNLNQVADGAAVLADGALIITYSDFQRPVGGPERAFRGRAGALETRRVWAMISTDQAETFSPPMLVTEACYGRPTFLAIDPSDGPSRDRLFLVCLGDEAASVLLTSSESRGEEWTDARPVEAPAAESRSRLYPQVAVNRAGVVAVAWMDRRDDPSGNCYAPYLVTSADGGQTFSAPVRVAGEVSCPDLDGAGRAGSRFPTGGDYFGLAAAADGRFHVIWPDARDGTPFKLRTASVAVTETRP